MAKVTNAFSTYGAQGNREELSNTINNISKWDTPVWSIIGTRKVSSRQFDWQTESLPAVDTTAREEGFVNVNSAATPTVRLSNVCQINSIDVSVTGSQEKTDAAGKGGGEMAHQMALMAKALKRNLEIIACGTQARNNGNDSGTARRTRALEHFITTNVDSGTGYANPASETAALTDGTLREFTQHRLQNILQLSYTNSAEPSVMVLGPQLKQKFSGFSGRLATRVNVDPSDILASADYYLSDFGEIKVVPSRRVRTRTALLLDPNYVKKAMFRPFFTKDLAPVGDAETKMIVVEWGLEVGHEGALAKIADLDPAL